MKKNKKLSQLNDAPLTQPQNRTERFLAKIARLADTAPADTRTRLERYLAAIVQSTAGAGIISADTETTVEGILFGNSTTGKVEGVVPEMSAENVADYLEAVEEAVTAGGLVNSSQLNKWQSNPNLLDNGYFVGGGSQQGGGQFPINQRGGTIEIEGQTVQGYEGTNGYTLDRILLRNYTRLLIESDHIHIEQTQTGGSKGIVFPNLSTEFATLQGQAVTLSIVAKGSGSATIFCAHSNSVNGASGNYISLEFSPDDTYRLYTVSDVIPTLTQTYFNTWCYIADNSTLDIKAFKLELGDTQTLAHQDANGNWVLNEIPNYQEQLARCQRYQWFPDFSPTYAQIGFGMVRDETTAMITMRPPVTMYKSPTLINIPGETRLKVRSGNVLVNAQSIDGALTSQSTRDQLLLLCTIDTGATLGAGVLLYKNAADCDKFYFDANL